MYPEIKELMSALNCKKWPKRWEDIYDSVMTDFDKNGCRYTDPAYYDEIGEKYSILIKYRDLYKEAAAAVGRNEYLSRFFALLCASLNDPENTKADLKEISYPKTADGSHDLAYDMLTALAVCSQADLSYGILKAKKLSDELIVSIMRLPENGIDEYKMRNDGNPGYHLIDWFQFAVNGQLVRVNRLEMDLISKFSKRARVFKNKAGELVVLACDIVAHASGHVLGTKCFEDEEGSFDVNYIETDDAYEGYPVDERGLVINERVTLKKSEWEMILAPGDTVVGVHIPYGGGLTEELVDLSIANMRKILAEYFPEHKYKAFTCHSWLLDPQLADFVGKDSNMGKFEARYRKLPSMSDGNAVFGFLYHTKPDVDLNTLPENTRLERAVKQHYLDGKAIYEVAGFFF